MKLLKSKLLRQRK